MEIRNVFQSFSLKALVASDKESALETKKKETLITIEIEQIESHKSEMRRGRKSFNYIFSEEQMTKFRIHNSIPTSQILKFNKSQIED